MVIRKQDAIPESVLKALDIKKGERLLFVEEDGEVRIKKVPVQNGKH